MVAPEGFDRLEASQWVFIGLARVGLVGDRGLLKMMGGDNREEAGGGGSFDWASGGARLALFLFFAFCPRLTIVFEFFLR